ncbi:MAG: NGG1p interacting factor 3 protein [Flavipsychrobacter sp.]|nr:NGG1p interacting factor 3 protein [Flavipsychrobacter sp.]
MLVKDIIAAIEVYAPLVYQESYDNCGLQVGNLDDEVKGVLISLDVTEAILDEAIERGCNMIVSHHPLIFSGLKKISGRNYVERVVQRAIKNDISIYAAHTNLDNMYHGVNARIAQKLGLVNTSILAPKSTTISKLYAYAPAHSADAVRDALFVAGAGKIGLYSEASFNTKGIGTFRADATANPTIGTAGGEREWVDEVKIEVIVEKHNERSVLQALFASHPYEEVAYELIPLSNTNQQIGAGMIGTLVSPMEEVDFLAFLKQQMKTDCIRHTALKGKKITSVAVCGGSGSFLLGNAIQANADIFITGDFKYHQFFDAEGKIVIADIGHYESEQFTSEIFETILNEKFPNFAILLSNLSTNPVKYFC